MSSNKLSAWVLSTALAATSAVAAEDSGCGHTIESAPKTVQATLNPAYGDPKLDLKPVALRMSELMTEIGRCQAFAQDPANDSPNKNHDIAEWLSLNQWMYRLTSFVDQNSRGDFHMDWKREFEIFVDVYELPR